MTSGAGDSLGPMARVRECIGFAMGGLLAVLSLGPDRADALSVQVALDTAAFASQRGTLALDFIDGDGTQNNSATISGFFPAASIVAAPPPSGSPVTGGVSGTLSLGALRLTDTQFFNELLQPVTLGSPFSFRVDLTEAFVNTGQAVPDAFAFFLLDADALTSLTATTDPTGANALGIIQSDGTFTAFSSRDLPITVSAIPEPALLWLVAWGLAILLGLLRIKVQFAP